MTSKVKDCEVRMCLVPLRNVNKQGGVRKVECSEMQPDEGWAAGLSRCLRSLCKDFAFYSR